MVNIYTDAINKNIVSGLWTILGSLKNKGQMYELTMGLDSRLLEESVEPARNNPKLFFLRRCGMRENVKHHNF